MIKTQAPGKMILIGEYAVLEGAPALVCAVDCFAELSLISNHSNEYIVESPSLKLNQVPFVVSEKGHVRFNPNENERILKKLNLFAHVFEEIYRFLLDRGKKIHPSHILINTQDFYSFNLKTKFGFGSSAAMTVALTNSILTFERELGRMSPYEIFQLAYFAHRKAQGNLGSGIDVAASTFGGIVRYQLDENNDLLPIAPKPIDVIEEIFMIPIWAGHSTSTQKMVKGIDVLKGTKRNSYNMIMHQLTDCSKNSCAYYQGKEISLFLESIREYNQLLQKLGEESGMPIVSDKHKQLTHLLEKEGAYYKPSGAGGGDIGICFCESEKLIHKILDLLAGTEFTPLNFKVTENGVRTVEN